MRFLLIAILLVCFSLSVFSQTEQKKSISLSPSKMKEQIVKQEFLNVPQEVRKYHATGTWRFRVSVDETGKIENILPLNKYSDSLNEYLEKTIRTWKFKPLVVDEVNVSYRGIIFIPFCYGSFSSWCFD